MPQSWSFSQSQARRISLILWTICLRVSDSPREICPSPCGCRCHGRQGQAGWWQVAGWILEVGTGVEDTRPRVNGKTKSETMKERRAGWQKLAAFRWRQKWPWKLSSSAYLLFSRQMRHRKFANLTQYNMQYIPCNSELLVQETQFLTQKALLFIERFPKSAWFTTNFNIATK